MPTLLFAVGEVIMLDICLHRRRILEIALGRSRFLPRSVLFPFPFFPVLSMLSGLPFFSGKPGNVREFVQNQLGKVRKLSGNCLLPLQNWGLSQPMYCPVDLPCF